MGKQLKALFERQLDGEFDNREAALDAVDADLGIKPAVER